VADEETTLYPPVDCHANSETKVNYTLFFIIVRLSVIDSLEEEGLE